MHGGYYRMLRADNPATHPGMGQGLVQSAADVLSPSAGKRALRLIWPFLI
jgi:hypothetical protein